jgi:DNA-binding NtrC family response regulator
MTAVLLVGTNQSRLTELQSSLQAKGLRVSTSEVSHALSSTGPSAADCVVCISEDLPDVHNAVLAMSSYAPCILIDHLNDARHAVAAMKAGAADYLIAPFAIEELVDAIQSRCAPADENPSGPLNMVGSSKPMAELFELIRKVAPTESAVLIDGESGTGKDLVARALHSASGRNHAPLITLNCATTPDQLIESELFGYPDAKNGSANSPRRGLLQAAHGGTLFLDEIGELPAHVQARLQQVLEAGIVQELETGAEHHVDVRLISSTHRNLKQLISNNLFRDDLFYRINVVNLSIPPLRERGQDILRIAELFLEQTTRKLARSCAGFSSSAQQAMLIYDWPGNVRELENAIERAVILCSEGEINEDLLAIGVNASTMDASPGKPADQTSLENYFVSFVTSHEDQLTETELAQKLGISRKSLWERRQRLNIPRKRTKKRGPRRDNS